MENSLHQRIVTFELKDQRGRNFQQLLLEKLEEVGLILLRLSGNDLLRSTLLCRPILNGTSTKFINLLRVASFRRVRPS